MRFVDAKFDNEVLSTMLGLPIKITQQSLAANTRCSGEGTLLENWYESRVGYFIIKKKQFKDPKVNYKVVHLKPKYRVLFKILIWCVVSKGGLVDHVNKDHKGLMWNISQRIKTNPCHPGTHKVMRHQL